LTTEPVSWTATMASSRPTGKPAKKGSWLAMKKVVRCSLVANSS
jgi:hypothetical protein